MKKVYMFIAMLLIAGITMAQTLDNTNPNVRQRGSIEKMSTQIVKPGQGVLKAIIDTMGWTTTSTPCFGSPTGTVGIVGMIDGNDNPIGYWFGTSGYCSPDSLEADMWAQCWINNATVKVAGVLFVAGGKYIMNPGSVANSNVVMGVTTMEPYVSGQHGCITDFNTTPPTFGPSPVEPYLASGTMNIADIDTSFMTFNYIPFTTMPTVSADFCALSDWKGIRTNCGDTAFMLCDATGNGLSMHFSQYCVNWNTHYFVSCLASGASLDRNISMFAVIDDGAGIADEGYFQGMKMSLRNNPAVGNFFIDYTLQYASNITVKLFDMAGKEVMTINEGKKSCRCS